MKSDLKKKKYSKKSVFGKNDILKIYLNFYFNYFEI